MKTITVCVMVTVEQDETFANGRDVEIALEDRLTAFMLPLGVKVLAATADVAGFERRNRNAERITYDEASQSYVKR